MFLSPASVAISRLHDRIPSNYDISIKHINICIYLCICRIHAGGQENIFLVSGNARSRIPYIHRQRQRHNVCVCVRTSPSNDYRFGLCRLGNFSKRIPFIRVNIHTTFPVSPSKNRIYRICVECILSHKPISGTQFVQSANLLRILERAMHIPTK